MDYEKHIFKINGGKRTFFRKVHSTINNIPQFVHCCDDCNSALSGNIAEVYCLKKMKNIPKRAECECFTVDPDLKKFYINLSQQTLF